MRAKDDPFVFSVIMSVYQVKDYIDEAIGSLINQTIGFDKIQLILVDDGSTDGSGEICDRYLEKYPDQIKVIHKENGGLSSARNTGLPCADGKYVSFFDPDDILDLEALKKIHNFMEQHEEVDVCCIPIYFFGDRYGGHPLNYKYKKGTRVADLSVSENANCVVLSAATSFFRLQIAQSMLFDTQLYQAEDSKEILKILLNNPRVGLIADTKYHYRRHSASIIGKSRNQKRAYTEYLQLFSVWALDYAEQKCGFIPEFVQYTVMYDLQWKVRQGKIPDDVLNEEEKQEYKELMFSIFRRIDDSIILHQKTLSKAQQLYVLGRKYGHLPELRITDDQKDIELYYGEKSVFKVSWIKSGIEFISVDREKAECTLEGYHVLYGGIENEELASFIAVNGETYQCEQFMRVKNTVYAMDDELTWRMGFRATFPLQQTKNSVYPVIRVGKTMIKRKIENFGQYFPVSSKYSHMQANQAGYIVRTKDGELTISPQPAWIHRTSNEIALLREIWHKNYKGGGKKAVAGRLYYHFVKLFKRRKLWILSDRIMKADDNGEALFRYLMKNKPPKTRVLFAISKDSTDAKRLAQIGPCVDAMSLRHKLLHLLCDVNISAQADGITINPYSGRFEALRDLLAHQHFVFLQHGITKDDISDWLNRYNKNISGFVAAAIPEYQSLLGDNYAYSPDNIWLTGFPRYDRLYHKEEKKITLMPTWRRYLMDRLDSKTGTWIPVENINDSDYCQFYKGLLNSNRLINALQQYGFQLQFFPHPNVRLSGMEFDHDPRVAVLPMDTFYREIYATSKLIITDYSSAVFDFAYLRKPVLYCQFDQDEFFAGEHVYTKGYFDYERDGFGEVTYDLESTIDRIIEYAANDCELKNEYRDRIDRFFAFNDQENCRRVTEKILQMQSEW